MEAQDWQRLIMRDGIVLRAATQCPLQGRDEAKMCARTVKGGEALLLKAIEP